MDLYFISKPIDEKMRREIIYSGGIIVFKDILAVKKLQTFVKNLTFQYFGDLDPLTASEKMEETEYLKTVDTLQRTFSNDPTALDYFRDLLFFLGLDKSETFWGRPTFRIQPSHGKYKARQTIGIGPHRDTWYANVFQQTNWWMPIFPLSSENTLAFYPSFWEEKIQNTTKGWDLFSFRQARENATLKKVDVEGLESAYPRVKVIDKNLINDQDKITLIIEPGDIVNFSGAHLHEGVENTSGVTRFSIEVRTVNVDDIKKNIAAPNVDTESSGNSFCDFYNIVTNVPLVSSL